MVVYDDTGFRGEQYKLKLFDQDLMEFDFFRIPPDAFSTRITSANKELASLFPTGLELTDSGLLEWLRGRVIPKNRAHVAEILKPFGLTIHDTKGIIDVCLGLSLNDSYWVAPSDFDGKWADFNLYENHFSEVLSLIAYTGHGQELQGFTTSPELTTSGALPKAWRTIAGDGLYLYKGGTVGASNTGWEPFSEVLAYQVAEAMGIDAVPYELVKWKDIIASRCKIFTSADVSFVPAYKLIAKGRLEECFKVYSDVGNDALEQLRSMLLFDCIIYNQDRHFGNFGLLRDSHTGQFLGPAPVFDNGYSLFNFCGQERFSDDKAFQEYIADLSPACTRGSFTELALMVMGSKQHQQLRYLRNFRFSIPEFFPMPRERIQRIESQIHKRVSELLALPVLHEPVQRPSHSQSQER